MNFVISFGCAGRTQSDGFVLCNSVENIIVKINESIKDRKEIIEFLESAGLFDEDIYDGNKIMNIVAYLKDRFNLIPHDKLIQIQMFRKMHTICGIYLKMEIE